MKKQYAFIGLAVVLLALGIVFKDEFLSQLQTALSTIESLGVTGMVYFVLIYVLATVLLLPGSVLTLAAGVLYGVWIGTVVVSVASTLGATLAFLLSRGFLNEWVQKLSLKYPKIHAFQGLMKDQGWKLTFLLRLSPVIPFNALNYLLGITRVQARDYVIASWLGMIPGTFLYVYLGTLIRSLADVFDSTPNESIQSHQTWILIGGFVVTLGVVVGVTLLAKKALRDTVES